jgi:hypothetical protein
VHCLEVSATQEAKVSPASERALQAWRSKGLEVRAASVSGEPFWSTIEISECEALLAATESSLDGAS